MADPYRRDRRLGRWIVDQRHMEHYGSPYLDVVQRHVVVLRAMPMHERFATEFIGRSEHFDVVDPGDVIPEYVPTFTDDGFKWEKRA